MAAFVKEREDAGGVVPCRVDRNQGRAVVPEGETPRRLLAEREEEDEDSRRLKGGAPRVERLPMAGPVVKRRWHQGLKALTEVLRGPLDARRQVILRESWRVLAKLADQPRHELLKAGP